MHRFQNQIRLLVIAFLLLAAAQFALRGPWRMHTTSHSNDFETLYTSARAWLHGQNPYDHSILANEWKEAGGDPAVAPSQEKTPSVYPLATFVLIAPLAILPWKFAQLAWLACNLASIAILLESLRRLMNLRWLDTAMLLLTAFTIGLRPYSNAIALGQMSLTITAAAAVIILLADRNWKISAALYALVLGIKAPLSAALIVPELIGRRWRIVTVTFILVAVLMGIGIARLGNPNTWLPDWRANLQSASAPGGVNDPTPSNPYRHQLINLQYPLSSYISNRTVVNAITILTGVLIAIPPLLRLREKPRGQALLLPLSCFCLVELFVIYHRTYDAAFLVFPLAWALLKTTPPRQAWPTLALIFILVLPSTGPLTSGSAAKLWLWDRVILPHDTWAIFLLSLWLSICCGKRSVTLESNDPSRPEADA
jgi:hypothetical protein